MTPQELKNFPEPEFTALREAVQAETVRRSVVRDAPAESEQRSRDYLRAVGRTDGAAWVQPLGAHDAYPEGYMVTHDGKTWESLTPANVWEPGTSGWREVVEEGSGPPAFVPPTGAHDAYAAGDRVTFQGSVYESLISGNVYSPTAYPAGWRRV